MNDFLLFINRILIVVAWIVLYSTTIKKSLHMFQQNRYEIRRYWPWLLEHIQLDVKQSIKWVVIYVSYIAIAFIANRYPSIGSTLVILLTLLLSYQFARAEQRTSYIKKLNMTSRVKRQIVVMVALVLITLYLVFMLDWMWISLFTPIMIGIIWVYVIVMALITLPFEGLVKRFYIHKAKMILNQQSRLIKIGITGSYGKTSSKNILNEILSEKYYVLSTPASFNTPMGLTITIREQLKTIHQVFIAEMGADKVGEIDFLSKFIRPQYAIITSIGPQHLNTFKTLDNIIREKMRLVENLPVSGVCVINFDYDTVRNYRIKNNCKIIRYAIDHEADFMAKNIEYSPNGSKFDVVCSEGTYPFMTRLLGKHNIANILAGIALGRQLGLSWEMLQKAVSNVNYVEHRLQLKKINGFNYIDNAFNSNPEGAKMSLEVLKLMPNHRYIVTPGMIDLGVKQYELNKQFGAQMKDHVDTVLLVGRKQTQPIYEGLKESGFDMDQVIVLDTVKEAFKYIESHANKDDIILLENDLPDAFNH